MAVVAHELGHTLGLNHPSSGTGAVMDTNGAIESTRSRDLYQYDLKCTSELSGARALTTYRRQHNLDGSFGAETAVASTLPVAKASSGITKINGTWFWSTVVRGTGSPASCWAWLSNHDVSTAECTGADSQAGIGATAALWREDESVDRVFYASHDESPAFEPDATHSAKQTRSLDKFVTQNVTNLLECSSMSGFMTCSSTATIRTGQALAVAWDHRNDRSVTAWTRQSRDDSSTDRRIFVATGQVSTNVVPVATDLGVNSIIPPAVTCASSFTSTSYDCIVAYVPDDDRDHQIRIRRYRAAAGSTRYGLTVDPTIHLPHSALRTASRVALWYKAGYYFLAARTLSPGQAMELWQSADGATWTSVASNFGYSATGPTAVGYWAGSTNMVTYAH